MKWSIVLLLLLGVVAALCAAMLVISIQNRGSGQVADQQGPTAVAEGSYVVAARDLEVRTMIPQDAVEDRTAAASLIPIDAIAQSAEVIGQVLRTPLKKGQAFTRRCFASEGGVILAGALKEGQRAVSVPLADSGGIESLLYPGCIVDVLASMQVRDEGPLGDQPIAVTLLQGVYVLAVGDQAVTSAATPEESKGLVRPGPRSTVTLLVDSKQAEMLYLARQRGTISIALRNPTDEQAGATEGTRLAHLGPIMANAEKAAVEKLRARQKEEAEALKREREKQDFEMERARFNIERDRKQNEIDRVELEKKKLEADRSAEKTIKPEWETVIVRGGVAEIKKFQIPEKKP